MTIPKQMIEAGARALYSHDYPKTEGSLAGPWEETSEHIKNIYRDRTKPVIQAALSSLWQPIESAPRDGSPVLLLPHMVSASWDFGAENWLVFNIPLNKDQTVYGGKDAPAMWFEFMADHYDVKPTHWMPADAIPQPMGEEG